MGPLTPREPFLVFPEYHRCSAGNRTWTIRWSLPPPRQVMDHTFNVTTQKTLFGEMATVLWDLITNQSVTCQVSEWAEHNRNKRLLQTCYTLKKKQKKRKNSPSLGTNAPGQLNSHHLASYSTNKLQKKKKKKKNIEKKEGKDNIFCFTWSEQHLHGKKLTM